MKCTYTVLGNSFPEVNISVKLSKDKAQPLKDHQENGVSSMAAHEVYDPLLILFCTQSCHSITGKQTYHDQAKP